MNKSYFVHYKNKYPKGAVHADDLKLDAYNEAGEHCVALRSSGGAWHDVSKELGCRDQHDLAPIPRNTRAWKLCKDGSVGKDEEFESRKAIGEKLAAKYQGRVPSIDELKKAGEKLDEEYGKPSKASWVG